MRPVSTLVVKIVSFLFLALFAVMIAFILLLGIPKAAKAQEQKKGLNAQGLKSGSVNLT